MLYTLISSLIILPDYLNCGILFLKYLQDLESVRQNRAELNSETYAPLVNSGFRCNDWAAPKTAEGSFDHNKAMIGDDLIAFVWSGLSIIDIASRHKLLARPARLGMH